MASNEINITTQDGNSVVITTTDTNVIEIITAGPQGPKGDSGGGTTNIDTGSFITYLQTGSMSVATASYIDPLFISASAAYYGFGSGSITNTINIDTGSFAITGSNTFIGTQTITGSINVNSGGITGSLYNKTFTKNNTTISGTNIILSNENVFNHGNLLIETNDTLIIEDGAEYFILGDLTNSGSIVVSGSLIVHGAIYNSGSITGPGPILSNSTIVTYDKANIAYGFLQLDNTGNIANTISLLGTASFSLTASYIDPNFISASAAAAGFGSGSNNTVNINTGSFATTGSNTFIGTQTITGSINISGESNFNNAVAVNDSNLNLTNSSSLNLTSGSSIFIDNGSLTVTSGGITGSLYNEAFSKNRTTYQSVNTIKEYESIFNPSNLFIGENDIFIVEQNAEYYVLGDLINSGSIIVNGTLKMNGVLNNNGSITGIGIIE